MKLMTRKRVCYTSMPEGTFEEVLTAMVCQFKDMEIRTVATNLTVEVDGEGDYMVVGTFIESDEDYLQRLQKETTHLLKQGVTIKEINDANYAEFLRLKAIFEPDAAR